MSGAFLGGCGDEDLKFGEARELLLKGFDREIAAHPVELACWLAFLADFSHRPARRSSPALSG